MRATTGPVVSRDCLVTDPLPAAAANRAGAEDNRMTIPQRSQVWVSPWLLHRNPKYWEEQVNTYHPPTHTIAVPISSAWRLCSTGLTFVGGAAQYLTAIALANMSPIIVAYYWT